MFEIILTNGNTECKTFCLSQDEAFRHAEELLMRYPEYSVSIRRQDAIQVGDTGQT